MSSAVFRVIILFLWLDNVANAASCTHDGLEASLRWQEIKSPGFPNRFPSQTQCSWRIEAPQNFRVKIQFSSFALVPPTADNKCIWQGLDIMNGDKDPEDPANFFTVCGRDNPGTLISTGQVLRVNLHSNARSDLSDYIGFLASYSMTQEDPVMRATASDNAPSSPTNQRPLSYDSDPNHQSIGSVLNQLNRNNPVKYGNTVADGMTQSERAEAINRRRNLGLPVNDNPRYDENGNPLKKQQVKRRNPKANSTAVTINSVQHEDAHIPYKKKEKGSSLSPQIKTVLIVIALIAAFFILILLSNKLGFFKYLNKMKERKNEKKMKRNEDIATVTGKSATFMVEDEKKNEKTRRKKRRRPESRKRDNDDVTKTNKEKGSARDSTERRKRRRKRPGKEGDVMSRGRNATPPNKHVTGATNRSRSSKEKDSDPSKRRRRRKRRREENSSSPRDKNDVTHSRRHRTREERSRRSRQVTSPNTSSSNEDPPRYERINKRQR